MDERLQTLLRQARADPGDHAAIARAIEGLSRAGQAAPADLLDRQVLPPVRFASQRALAAVAELPDGRWASCGATPGEVQVPACRTWWVNAHGSALEDGLAEELAAAAVPGLRLTGQRLPPQALLHLAAHPGLRRLSLRSLGVGDAGADALPPSRALVELDLSGCGVTGEGLGRLATRAPHLSRLALDNARGLTDLAPLADLPHLGRLSACGARVTRATWQTLPRLPGVTHLCLYGSPVSAADVRLLVERLPGLRELTIEARRTIREDLLLEVAEAPRLTHLTLLSAQLAGLDVACSLAPLERLSLRTLHLDVNGDHDLRPLTRIPTLRELVLRYPEPARLEPLIADARLRRLGLQTYAVEEVFRALARSESIERLDLDLVASSRRVARASLGLLAPGSVRLLRLSGHAGRSVQGGITLEGAEQLFPASRPPSERQAEPWVLLAC